MLPLSSCRSLSNTSQRFRQLIDGQSLLGAEVLEFVCLLERDQSANLVCSKCCRYHKPEQFSDEERMKPPGDRQCRGTKGLLWLCPYTAISYGELKARIEEGSLGHCSHESCQYSSGARWFSEDGCFGLHICYFITMGYGPQIPPLKTEIADILRGFDIPICPHLRTSDSTVLNSYNAGKLQCQVCLTTLKMRAVSSFGMLSRDNACYVALCVSRRVGSLSTPSDPRWLPHLVEGMDTESITTEWVSSSFWLCQRESYKIEALWPKNDVMFVFASVLRFYKRPGLVGECHGDRLRGEFQRSMGFALPPKARWKSFWMPLVLPPRGAYKYDDHFNNRQTLPLPF